MRNIISLRLLITVLESQVTLREKKMQTDLVFIVGEFGKILLVLNKEELINVKRLKVKYSFTLLKQKLVCIGRIYKIHSW